MHILSLLYRKPWTINFSQWTLSKNGPIWPLSFYRPGIKRRSQWTWVAMTFFYFFFFFRKLAFADFADFTLYIWGWAEKKSQACGFNGCCAWLWPGTGWSPSTFSWFGTIYVQFPNMKKILCLEAVSDRWWGHNVQFRTFSKTRMRASKPRDSTERCNNDGRCVWTAGETMLEKKTTFGQVPPLPHSLWLWTFSAHPRINWASKETYHFFRVTFTKIHCIKMIHILTQIR